MIYVGTAFLKTPSRTQQSITGEKPSGSVGASLNLSWIIAPNLGLLYENFSPLE